MVKTKKQSFIIIGAFALVLMLGTVTYAFFNYTRTGTANTIRTGRIAFNSAQGTAINLTNMFPIDVSEGIPNDATKVGTVTINVTGDTTYTSGLEYLVTAVNVSNTVGSKNLPISIDVSVSNNTNNDPATTLGTSDDDYFTDRGSTTSYYKILAGETINTDDKLVVGYIAPGATGVDGNIVIRAYLDAAKIAISDTYDESEPGTNNMGTTTEWVDDREVFTTTEWNSLQTNGVSFQVKVESNEGIWVDEVRTVNTIKNDPIGQVYFSSQILNIKELYFNKMGTTTMQNAYDNATIKADLTYNNEGKVLAWLETNESDNTKYNLIVASDGDTYLKGDYASFFVGFTSLEKIEFNNINTLYLTGMQSMFSNCSSLTMLDLSKFDIVNLDSGGLMSAFNNCTSLTRIYVSNLWDASSQYSGMPIFGSNTSLVGVSPNNTYNFDSSKRDKSMAVIATDTTEGYLTDISLKPSS